MVLRALGAGALVRLAAALLIWPALPAGPPALSDADRCCWLGEGVAKLGLNGVAAVASS